MIMPNPSQTTPIAISRLSQKARHNLAIFIRTPANIHKVPLRFFIDLGIAIEDGNGGYRPSRAAVEAWNDYTSGLASKAQAKLSSINTHCGLRGGESGTLAYGNR